MTGLLDRGPALEAVQTALAELAQGRGAALLFEGPAGIGKTRLLEEALELGRARGMGVVRATGSETEQALAWGVALQLGERLMSGRPASERASLLAGMPAVAAALFGQPFGLLPGGFDELARVHGAFTLLARLAEEVPLLLVVDDLHWADSASLRLLLYLLARLEELRVALVLARRADDPSDEEGRMQAIAAHPRVAVHRLGPLSAEAVTALVRARLGAAGTPKVAEACLASTGGNPFYLHALLMELAAEPVEDSARLVALAREAVPDVVVRYVIVRVGRLGRDAVGLARSLAILGEGAALRHAAGLSGLEIQAGAEAADLLARAEILCPGEPLRFVHPLVRGAIEHDIPAALRATLHLQAARLLYAEHQPSERVAAQLLPGTPTGDPWAVERLREAAAASLGATAPDSAVRYLRRALEEPPGDRDTRAQVLAELGRAEALASRPEAVAHLGQAAELVSDPLDAARLGLERGRALYSLGRHTEAAAAVDESLALLPEALEGEALALHDELQALFVGIGLLVPELHPEALARAQRVLARIEGPLTYGQRSLLAQAAAQAAVEAAGRERARMLAERAWEDGRLIELETSSGPAWTFVTGAFTQVGEFERSIAVADVALADARRRAAPFAFATGMYIRGCPLLLAGQVGAALADLEAALDARRYGWAQFVRAALGYYASALIQAGQLERAEAALGEAGRFDPVGDLEDVALLGARGELRLARGELEGALADGLATLGGMGRLNWFGATFRMVGAHAALGLGRHDQARELAERELSFGERADVGYTRVSALRALGLIEGGNAGLELLRQAVELGCDRDRPRHLEGLLAMVELGAALRRGNQRAEARPLLQRAADLALARGALAAHQRARTELAATGARPRREALLSGPASLTPSERRIADLAAEGMSNREIAAALFVTPKTVEYHLRNAYMKLGIERRGELAAALAA